MIGSVRESSRRNSRPKVKNDPPRCIEDLPFQDTFFHSKTGGCGQCKGLGEVKGLMGFMKGLSSAKEKEEEQGEDITQTQT